MPSIVSPKVQNTRDNHIDFKVRCPTVSEGLLNYKSRNEVRCSGSCMCARSCCRVPGARNDDGAAASPRIRSHKSTARWHLLILRSSATWYTPILTQADRRNFGLGDHDSDDCSVIIWNGSKLKITEPWVMDLGVNLRELVMEKSSSCGGLVYINYSETHIHRGAQGWLWLGELRIYYILIISADFIVCEYDLCMIHCVQDTHNLAFIW